MSAVSLLCWLLAYACLGLIILLTVSVSLVRFCLRRKRPTNSKELSIGVFHPYANAGGGGERVLWVAIKALEQLSQQGHKAVCYIYTGDHDATPESILAKAKSRFFVDISPKHLRVEFVYIEKRRLLEASRWPRFTMLGQSLGSMALAYECLTSQPVDIFLDTTGYAFTYIIARLAGCRIASYTHYPTITSDMLARVHERRPTYNNDSSISNSVTATTAKVIYYRIFSWLYWFAGSFTEANMVNSTWTKNHVDSLWKHTGSRAATVVFPPCNTEELQRAPLGERSRVILSVGQFRPEKDHQLQLASFAEFKQRDPSAYADVRLVILGGARDSADKQRVEDLRARAASLGVSDSVEFMVNAPFEKLREALSTSLVGIHTMWNEHFGIGIVEMMAAGAIPIAHNSGGPKSDIVVPFEGQRTGYLATTPSEYADAMEAILRLTPAEQLKTTAAARESTARFSDKQFSDDFIRVFSKVLPTSHSSKSD